MQIETNITETETKTENRIKNFEIYWVEVARSKTIMQIDKEMGRNGKNNRKKKTRERYKDRRAEMLD